MPELTAIDVFPKEWGNKVRCPICHSRAVEIQRSGVFPDKIHCPNCGVSFQIEQKGNHIKLLELPMNFSAEMKNRWVTRMEVEEALKISGFQKSAGKSQGVYTKKDNSKSNLTRAEAVRRARSLVQLKNDRNAIRDVLYGFPDLSEGEIDEIIQDAFNVYAAQQKQRNRKTIIFSLVVILLLVVFFIVLNALI